MIAALGPASSPYQGLPPGGRNTPDYNSQAGQGYSSQSGFSEFPNTPGTPTLRDFTSPGPPNIYQQDQVNTHTHTDPLGLQ
ncbi:unnamed protein product [Oncorhynchus mykiss]|uniref:Uncharacterized protein n=1 Tax=Oncorhynchus mykiss TaxID=8022 RepID=A0A060YZH8_ONCMY|nr:unnamed protein product [Oncorhynchus mykiss]